MAVTQSLRSGAWRVVELLTTPVVPADYLDVVAPLRNAGVLRARIEAQDQDMPTVLATLRESQQEAQAQEASAQELNALVALAEVPKPRKQDLARLAAVYQGTTEGHDTKMYRRAGELLRRG